MSKGLFDVLFGETKIKSKIIVEVDEKKKKANVEIEGSLTSI